MRPRRLALRITLPHGCDMVDIKPPANDDAVTLATLARDDDIITAAQRVLGRRIEGDELEAWLTSIIPELD